MLNKLHGQQILTVAPNAKTVGQKLTEHPLHLPALDQEQRRGEEVLPTCFTNHRSQLFGEYFGAV